MTKINQNIFKIIFLTVIVFNFSNIEAANNSFYYNVKNFNASGNGIKYDTAPVQAAIDSAFSQGGGTVYFPAGKYLLKTIVLKSNITLFLDNGTELLGSTELKEYKPQYGSFRDSGGKKFGAALIFANNAQNISIEGKGTINGQGFKKYYPDVSRVARPSIIRFIKCKNVKIEDVKLINSAAWVQHYIQCEDLTIKNITVFSYSNKNNDGIDIASCKRVLITGCNINSEDDSIVLKALDTVPCKNVVISNCIIGGLKSAVKTGTESIGGFENITISNCTVYGTRGISILCVDGGYVNNVTITNISMRGTFGVIALRLGARMRPYFVPKNKRPKGPGTFKNIMISNIQAVGVTENNDFIAGIPNHYIENVTLNNIRIEFTSKGKKEDSERVIPELEKEYPKGRMFGILPAYGFFIRHVKNVKLKDLSFSYKNNDERSVVKCEDVENLVLDGLTAKSNANSAPFIWVNKSSEIRIQNCSPVNKIDAFLKAEKSKNIFLINNYLSKAKHSVLFDENTKNEVIKKNNF